MRLSSADQQTEGGGTALHTQRIRKETSTHMPAETPETQNLAICASSPEKKRRSRKN
jgi:hypothetical protein